MINVLIVEDSIVMQQFLEHVLGSDPAIRVTGVTSNGEEALALLQFRKPDVITMDIQMPRMDGFEATRRIMESYPVPIVIVTTSLEAREVQNTFQALRAGAVAVVQKPVGFGHPDHAAMAHKLTETIKLMAEVKVVGRAPRPVSDTGSLPMITERPAAPIRIVAIGASIGGPAVLLTILSLLSEDFRAPLLIVQHIAEKFIGGMGEWLNRETSVPVHIATHGEEALPRHAYLAPDGCHMGITADRRIWLAGEPSEHGARPSVSYLFRSVTRSFGKAAVGVILTGMGQDGALELKEMKDCGAVTIAQDKASAVVHGMAGEAILLGGATLVLSPERIAEVLNCLSASMEGGVRSSRWAI